MRSTIVAVGVLAAVASAQSVSSLPQCGVSFIVYFLYHASPGCCFVGIGSELG